MLLNVVYVDDEVEARNLLKRAVDRYNEKSPAALIRLKPVASPSGLRKALQDSDDLVLADVYYESEDKLSEIIDIVRRADLERGSGPPIPVIAYTGRGEDALNDCLKRRYELFDIWDKSTAGPEYVTWRLTQVAIELSRIRPDSLIQRLIREMSGGAPWHKHVVEMTQKYGSGLTEADQIYQAGTAIENIANELGVWERPCKALWKLMADWEFVGRAVTASARGHARHVINVFWMGYYLLHHPELKGVFEGAWKQLQTARGHRLKPVARANALEGLSACWYYAGIFHDVAACGERYSAVSERVAEFVSSFPDLRPLPRAVGKWPARRLLEAPKELWKDLTRLGALAEPLWKASVRSGAPDHGVVAALHFRRCVDDGRQKHFAREAARAMAMHNLMGRIESGGQPVVDWGSEPIVCLLLLCDQLETWDRERGDETLDGPDKPGRAQLASVAVRTTKRRIAVKMCIDYIAPRHLDHAPRLMERERLRLEETLKEYPSRALARISRPWPFDLEVDCRLNGNPLSHGIKVVGA